MLKIGVIFGGKSVEHEISIITAVQAMNKINEEKYEIIPIYVTKNLEMRSGYVLRDMEIYQDMDLLKRNTKLVTIIRKKNKVYLQSLGLFKKNITDIDVLFPVGHGAGLEDGSIQGYANLLNIPCVGSSCLPAALGQDKEIQKIIYKSLDIPVIKYEIIKSCDIEENIDAEIKRIEKALKYPLIIKPATGGSSIGIQIAKTSEELRSAIISCFDYDDKLIVEEMLSNFRELNISIIGLNNNIQTSVIEEVGSKTGFLSFNDKYISGGKSKGMVSAKRQIPAKISPKEEKQIQEYAIKAFKSLGLAGVVRFDFILKDNAIYINEVNTIPGSLSFYLWEKTDLSYTDELDMLISLAIRKYKSDIKKTRSFNTNVLKGFSGLKGTKGLKK